MYLTIIKKSNPRNKIACEVVAARVLRGEG